MFNILRSKVRGSRRRLSSQARRGRPARHPIWDCLEERTLLNASSLDPTFGTGGSVTTDFPFPGAPALATSVVIDSHGRAIVAGIMSDAQNNNRVVVARYNPNGSLDTSFGSGGIVYTPIDQLPDNAIYPNNFYTPEARVTLDALGRIVVSGTNTAPPEYGPDGPSSPDLSTRNDFAVVRLEPGGSLDTSFGTGGMATIDIGATDPNTGLPVHTDDFASGVAIQLDGKIVVSGTTMDPLGYGNYDSNFAVARLNPDGRIDTSFGTNGRAIADFPAVPDPYLTVSFDTAESLALAPDGKIVVAGNTNPDLFGGSFDEFAVARFNTNGSLDSSFGSGGLVTADLGQGQPGSADDGYAVVVQPDGKIIVGGDADLIFGTTGPEFALLRLNVDGTRDATFGTDGQVITPVPDNSSFLSIGGLALQPNGKIVAAGMNVNYPAGDFVVARYNPDGSLDTGFGTGGLVVVNPPVDDKTGFSVAIQPSDGKIVFAGAGTTPSAFTGFLIERYNPDGSVDTGYGTNGTTFTTFNGLRNETNPVAPLVLPDGDIVVAVTASTNPPGTSSGEFGLVEYNPDGSLNTSFGTGGQVITDFGMQLNNVTGLALEFVRGHPKIVVVGTVLPPGITAPTDIGVARYNLDGSLDTSFGNGGLVTLNLGLDTSAGGVAVQPDGKIVVDGRASGYNNSGFFSDFALARYTVSGSLDTSFGTGGVVLTDLSPSNSPGSVQAIATSVVIQPDGRIVVGGAANFTEFALARYDSNGQLDSSFGTGGTVMLTVPSSTNGIADMALQPDGKIVAVGSVVSLSFGAGGSADDFAVLRFTRQGNLDSSFGNSGIVTTDLTPSGATSTAQNDDHATGVVIQPDGKIVVGGWTYNSGSYPTGSGYTPPVLALVRYASSGALDPTFGSGGIAVTGVPVPTYQNIGLAMQPDGKLLVSYATPANPFGGTKLGLARFLGMDLAIAGPSSGTPGEPLRFTGTFDGQATDSIIGAVWSFGDGTFLILPSDTDGDILQVTHEYARSGTYTVSLIVLFSSGGILATSDQVTITSKGAGKDAERFILADPTTGGIVDRAIRSLVEGVGSGGSSTSRNLTVLHDVASAIPVGGADQALPGIVRANNVWVEQQAGEIAVYRTAGSLSGKVKRSFGP